MNEVNPTVGEEEVLDLGTAEGEIEQTDNGWHEGDPLEDVDQTPEADFDPEDLDTDDEFLADDEVVL